MAHVWKHSEGGVGAKAGLRHAAVLQRGWSSMDALVVVLALECGGGGVHGALGCA